MRCLCLLLSLSAGVLIVGVLADEEKSAHGGHHEAHDPLDGEKEIDGERNKHRDHEAVLGSRKEAEEADELSPEEAAIRLEKLARRHDTDNDNRISREEFVSWILQSFTSLDEEEATERMKEEDTDGDGKLTWEEYFKLQYDYTLEELEKMKADPNKDEHKSILEMVEEDQLRFNTADVNKDGSLDLSEYFAFYHPYHYEHMHALEIARSLKDYDKDGDSVVTMSEYVGDIEDKESRLSEETQFKEYDKDGNGKLEGEELKAWLIQDNLMSAKEEVDHLMGVADEDLNGMLSMKEILDHVEDFTSSQATDYGATLEKMRDEL